VRKPIWPGVVLGAMLTLATAAPAHAADNYLIAEGSPTHQVTFMDERPAKELKGGLPLFFDPTYSIPDKRFTPLLTDVLGAELQARLGERLAGKPVTLKRLQVQNYFAATYQQNQAASLAVMGAVSGTVIASVKNKGAVDAIIFRAEGSVDGRSFSVEYAQAYTAGSCGGMIYNCAPARGATREVVIAGITQTAEAIAQALGAPPPAAPPAPPQP
jgi:hypothetical protein